MKVKFLRSSHSPISLCANTTMTNILILNISILRTIVDVISNASERSEVILRPYQDLSLRSRLHQPVITSIG
jgi:hypothetical protein